MKTLVFALVPFFIACGPREAPPKVVENVPTHPTKQKPEVEEQSSDKPPPKPGVTSDKEPEAEKCAGSGWKCVKVSFDKRAVAPRDTKLLGDPKIETTWSKTTDGQRAVTWEAFSKGAVDIALKRKPGDKNDVVVKLGAKGQEIVIDSKDAPPSEFSHVGIIAAEQGGELLIDIRYMQ